MKCTAYSRAERSSPADGVSSCKQSPRFSLSSAAPLKNTPFRVCFFNAFLTHLRDLFLNRAWSLSSALDDFSCKQSLIFACRQQLIKYRLFTTKTSCFLMCAKFFAHICTISSKLCVEPVVCARRSRILRALIAFSCQQQLYGLFCHRSLSAAVLFVLVFST